MPSMTDYSALSFGSFELTTTDALKPSQQSFKVKLPSDFAPGVSSGRPVLSFIANFRSSEGTLGVWANPDHPLLESQRVQTLSWDGTTRSDTGLWVVIDGTKFKAGEDNEIVFGFQSANHGTVRFRDVVLWFQRGTGA